MNDTSKRLGFDDVSAAGLTGWVHIRRSLRAMYRPADFMAGLTFVNRIGEAAQAANHHPDITLKYSLVAVTLSSHDVGGITQRDLDLASAITQIADELGLAPHSDAITDVGFALDTANTPAALAFWKAATGWEASEDAVQDAEGLLPELWFQDSDSTEADRQRFHLDVEVPRDQVEARLEAAIAAGGRLVDDGAAPRFWVLADPEGNKVCLCTAQDRSA